MSELKDKILGVLNGELDKLKHEFTDDLQPYLEEKAKRIADLEKKLIVGNDEEMERAKASMRHQKAHIADEVFQQALAKTERAKAVLEAVLGAVISTILK